MKYFSIGIALVFLWSLNSAVLADKVYTWTDAKGNLHILQI